jgi:hypothetical protein
MSDQTPAGRYFTTQAEEVARSIARAYNLSAQMQSAASGLPAVQVEAARKALHAIKAHLRDAVVLLHAAFPPGTARPYDVSSILGAQSPTTKAPHSER